MRHQPAALLLHSQRSLFVSQPVLQLPTALLQHSAQAVQLLGSCSGLRMQVGHTRCAALLPVRCLSLGLCLLLA